MKETFPIMGKTYKGLEEVLAKELQDMGAQDIEVGNRAVSSVSFKGSVKTPLIYGRWAASIEETSL